MLIGMHKVSLFHLTHVCSDHTRHAHHFSFYVYAHNYMMTLSMYVVITQGMHTTSLFTCMHIMHITT